MGKKDKRNVPRPCAPAINQPVFAAGAIKWLWGGVAAVACGMVLLRFTDLYGKNLPSRVCPFLILGGYAAVAKAFFWRYWGCPPEQKVANDSSASNPV